MIRLKNIVKRIARFYNADIVRYPYPELNRRKSAYNTFNIDLLLDVGANTGQYAAQARALDYKKNIVSFEPAIEAFKKLSLKSANDPHWEVLHTGIGAHKSIAEINISGNSYSSSILEMLPAHLETAPESKYISKETIQLDTIDNFLAARKDQSKNIFLKIDTQGYEWQVLQGALNSLEFISCIQLEMSLVELYKSEKKFLEITQFLIAAGFEIFTLEPEFYNKKTGQLLQIDGIFCNQKFSHKISEQMKNI